MAAPRVYKTAAIVLRHRKLGEADKILTLFTTGYGKLDAVAKGVRRPTSKLAGHVEPLTYSTLLLAQGRELDIITQAETLEPLTPLREDLERLGRGLYAAELVDRLTPDRQESHALFGLLLETLRRLASRDDLDLALRYFEVQLLDELGYRPQLDRCVSCGKALEPATNFWSAASGGVLCPTCAADEPLAQELSLNALKVLRVLQRGRFGDAARVRIAAALDRELERHLREYIRYLLERDLRSSAFLDVLRRKGARASR